MCYSRQEKASSSSVSTALLILFVVSYWSYSKREHLINQIRTQAEQINKLISQLEAVQRSQGQPPNLENCSVILQTSIKSTEDDSTDDTGAFSSDLTFGGGNWAIENWLAQAKESFLQFGNSISKNYLVSVAAGWESDEDGDPDDLQDNGEESGLEPSENGTMRNFDPEGRNLEFQGSNSSPIKKAPSDKPPNLPTEAAPWGLMGKLSLISNPNDQNPDNTGINSSTYFTSKQAHLISYYTRIDTTANKDVDEQAKNVRWVGPHILSRGMITINDAEKLFRM